MRLKVLLFLIALIPCLQGIIYGEVLTVGGPKADFSKVHQALAAAREGDVIYVNQGVYPAPLVIDGKSVTIIAMTGTKVGLPETVTVKNLKESQAVNLINLRFYKQYYKENEGLILENNKGAIRVEDCYIIGAHGVGDFNAPNYHPNGWPGLIIKDCSNVGISNCEIIGGNGSNLSEWLYEDLGYGGPGIVVHSSKNITMYNCIVQGGKGGSNYDKIYKGGGTGGDGCELNSSCEAYVSGGEFRGGNGGNVPSIYKGKGGKGGDGIEVRVLAVLKLTRNTLFKGGYGGMGQPNGQSGKKITILPSGSVHSYPGTGRSVKTASPVKEKQNGNFHFEGVQNDIAGLMLSIKPDSSWSPRMNGQLLLGLLPSTRIYVFGVIPPSGALTQARSYGELDPRMEQMTIYLQGIFCDSSGEIYLANPRTLVVLDETF